MEVGWRSVYKKPGEKIFALLLCNDALRSQAPIFVFNFEYGDSVEQIFSAQQWRLRDDADCSA